MQITLLELMDYCDWLAQARIWMPLQPCTINNQIDFSVWSNPNAKVLVNGVNVTVTNVNTPSIDLSVINVLNLTSWAAND
jgi:hypothetical protein